MKICTIILLLIAAPALAEVKTVCDTVWTWRRDAAGSYSTPRVRCHPDTTGDRITPISPLVSGVKRFAFDQAGERHPLNYEPLGIPRHDMIAGDDRWSDSVSPVGYLMPPLPATIAMPSIDDWVDCWIKKYRGKVCIFNDSGVGWWYEDQDGWHSVWLDIGPLNDHPRWPQPQVQGPRSIYDICKFNDTLGWWLDFDSVTNQLLFHMEVLPAHDQDDRDRMFLKIDTVCDCPKGFAKEYWTTQTWHYWNMDTGESGVRVDTAKFPFFRCVKWVDFLGTGDKDHGIEADPICRPETTVCVWDKDAGVGRMSYKVVVETER